VSNISLLTLSVRVESTCSCGNAIAKPTSFSFLRKMERCERDIPINVSSSRIRLIQPIKDPHDFFKSKLFSDLIPTFKINCIIHLAVLSYFLRADEEF
jgi:hypothetical protein